MQIKEKKYNYLSENNVFSFKEILGNGLKLQSFILFESEKYIDYQKDLLKDFLADFIDKVNSETDYDLNEVKSTFEGQLEQLNEKLKIFANKLSDINNFSIKGYVQIIAGNTLILSMIGDTSLLIFRDEKLYYKSYNSPDKSSKIDIFSGFVEGNIESLDEITYIGTKIEDILDQSDIEELENNLENDQPSFFDNLTEKIISRANKENIGYITNYYIHGNIIGSDNKSQGNIFQKNMGKGIINKTIENIKTKLNFKNKINPSKILKNKYFIVILILVLIILGLLFATISQIIKDNSGIVVESNGDKNINITIDSIKKEIFEFQQLDASSEEKGMKYNEIIEHLTILETNGKRLEDVENLKGIVEDNYYEGFKIDRIDNLTAFDDLATGIKSRIFTFNNTEKNKVGDLLSIDNKNNINVGGTKGALIGLSSETSRGNLIEYGIDVQLDGCASNLLKDGIYCYTNDGRIFNITKSGIEPIITADEAGFPDTVGSIGTYSSYLYIFQKSLNGSLNGVFGSRYKNAIAGSETTFQGGQHYTLADKDFTGANSLAFGDVTVDSTFLTRSDGSLYQLWRPSAYGTNLEIRQIKLLGGDTINNKYSNNVKVLASLNSKYVCLFDRDNNTFTVYTSNPLKTNGDFTSTYNLSYLFSFKFELKSEKIIDITIPDATGNKPEMYILTNEGINKVALYDFIASIENNNTLKATSSNDLVE